MFNPGKHDHRKIIDIHPDVPLEPDRTDVLPHNLSPSTEERAPGSRASVESHKEADEVDYR